MFPAREPSRAAGAGATFEHRHGAAPTTGMTRIAIREHLDGKAVERVERVSDEQYQAKPSRPRP